MAVLKNKRRQSQIEYERNYLGTYDYMRELIDRWPKRYMQILGEPMKDRLNQIYEKITRITDMYIEKVPVKKRYELCRETIGALEELQEWVYLYWIMSDGRNGIRPADAGRRDFMSKCINRQIYLLAGVMKYLDGKGKFGKIEVQYMTPFLKKDIEGIKFLELLYELNQLVYPKVIRIPLAMRDEEVAIACRYIRNAFYCAYTANKNIPATKRQYEKRRRYMREAISDMYRLDRPMLKLFMVHMFSDVDMTRITELITDSTKCLQGVYKSDEKQFVYLLT